MGNPEVALPDNLEVDPKAGHGIGGGETGQETDQEVEVQDKAGDQDPGPGDAEILETGS